MNRLYRRHENAACCIKEGTLWKTLGSGSLAMDLWAMNMKKMLTKMDGIRLIGFSDIDPKQLEDVREGLKRYASNEELIHDPDVQVVLIAANNNQHHDLVIQAARAGKDIICEKPVAMSLKELDEMVKVTEECGV